MFCCCMCGAGRIGLDSPGFSLVACAGLGESSQTSGLGSQRSRACPPGLMGIIQSGCFVSFGVLP